VLHRHRELVVFIASVDADRRSIAVGVRAPGLTGVGAAKHCILCPIHAPFFAANSGNSGAVHTLLIGSAGSVIGFINGVGFCVASR